MPANKMDPLWYKDAVFYEVDVRTFCDTNADGIGDVPGLTRKLEYHQQLGVSAIWLLPFYPRPHAVPGRATSPSELLPATYGTLEDFTTFAQETHSRGMRVVLELVLDAAEDRDWFTSVIERARRWLDTGVDALQVDVIPSAVKRAGQCKEDRCAAHGILRRLREVIDEEYPGRILLAGANECAQRAAAYFGNGDECHVAVNISLSSTVLMTLKMEDRHRLAEFICRAPDIPANCQWALFLRNHDELMLDVCTDAEREQLYSAYTQDPQMRPNDGIRRRLAPLLENDRRRIELAYALLFSLPGSPIIYYGNEIGMGDNIYLQGRDGVRTPMQWSFYRNGGFSTADPARLYSPLNADPVYGYQALNVEAQERQPFSMLNWMRRLIAIRQQRKIFGRGTIEVLESRNGAVLAYIRRYAEEIVLVVANLSGAAQAVELLLGMYAGSQPWEMLGGTPFREIGSAPYSLTLAPYGFYWLSLAPAARRDATHGRLGSVSIHAGPREAAAA